MRLDIPAASTIAEVRDGALEEASTLEIICGSLSSAKSGRPCLTGFGPLSGRISRCEFSTYNAFTSFCQALYPAKRENMLILRIQFLWRYKQSWQQAVS
jgi:hypothetical protein